MDLASLAESIKSGRVAGAAVDVYPTEPEKNSDGFQTGACLPGASRCGTCSPGHRSPYLHKQCPLAAEYPLRCRDNL